jgi:hypothetical protein
MPLMGSLAGHRANGLSTAGRALLDVASGEEAARGLWTVLGVATNLVSAIGLCKRYG